MSEELHDISNFGAIMIKPASPALAGFAHGTHLFVSLADRPGQRISCELRRDRANPEGVARESDNIAVTLALGVLQLADG